MKTTLRAKLIASASVLGLGMSLVFAPIAFAADLNWSNDTTIDLSDPDINLIIQSGSTAATMTTAAGTLGVTMVSGQTFIITSASRTLTVTGLSASSTATTTCDANAKSIIAIVAGASESVTITPGSAQCTPAGGGGGGGGTYVPPANTPTASLSANYSSVVSGTPVTLTWSTNNATSASMDQGIGAVATSGTRSVSPTATTTYTLTATGSGGTATQAVTITISSANVPTSGSSGSHSNGTLIIDNGTVYLIQNGGRVGFRDSAEYLSYGYNFGQAVAANAQDMAMPQAAFVQKALQGTLVLDLADGRTVYMIGLNGTKRGFTSSAVFKGLGYTFANLPRINLSDYPAGDPIGSITLPHPEGALVLNNGTVWWILAGQRQGFESAAVFNTYGFSWSKIVAANAADMALSEGSLVKFRDGTLVYDGGNYYLISDGQKKMFSSASDLTARGYKTTNAINASLAAYVSGGNFQ